MTGCVQCSTRTLFSLVGWRVGAQVAWIVVNKNHNVTRCVSRIQRGESRWNNNKEKVQLTNPIRARASPHHPDDEQLQLVHLPWQLSAWILAEWWALVAVVLHPPQLHDFLNTLVSDAYEEGFLYGLNENWELGLVSAFAWYLALERWNILCDLRRGSVIDGSSMDETKWNLQRSVGKRKCDSRNANVTRKWLSSSVISSFILSYLRFLLDLLWLWAEYFSFIIVPRLWLVCTSQDVYIVLIVHFCVSK